MQAWSIQQWAGDASVRELQRQSTEIGDRIERKYAGRMRVEQQRVQREVGRETDAEIRAAVEEMTR